MSSVLDVSADPRTGPESPEGDSKDIAASRRSIAEVAALPERERWNHGRRQHPTWVDADLQAWVRAQTQVDPDVANWFNSWRTTNRGCRTQHQA